MYGTAGSFAGGRTLYDLPDHFAEHRCQTLLASQMRVGELFLIKPELMQNRGVDVAEVIGILYGAQADVIGGPNDLSPLDTAPSEPHGETEIVMIAALAALHLGRKERL